MVELSQDTIIAPATAAGEGGIGIIRLSGPQAEERLLRFFRPSKPTPHLESHRLYFGHLFSARRDLLDEVMVVVMRPPRSYTCELVVEIHCHGGPLLMRRILDQFIDCGIRLARPGEFTLRAFLNGRIDLPRAEAVIDVIRARSDASASAALRQMSGALSAKINSFRCILADLLALVEAHIDFPEEDIDVPVCEDLAASAKALLAGMNELLSTYDSGRVLREGLSVLIVGRPNVGKSSLLNALLGESRAIVTAIPGTTRDFIEESLVLGGIPLRLVDTAGIRQTEDPVEAEGVRLAREKISHADLVLLVIDGTTLPGRDDLLALSACSNSRLLLVINKCDLPEVELPPTFADLPLVRVSAKTGSGMDALGQALIATFQSGSGADSRESVLLCDRRHRAALMQARHAVEAFLSGMNSGISLEFAAFEIRAALDFLGEITGQTTPDDILDRIFSRFCIGK